MYLFGNSTAGSGNTAAEQPNVNSTALMPPLLNPLTPLAFFPPGSAFEITVTGHVVVASLAIMVWDMLHTIGSDYILLARHKVRLPTVIYLISRLATLGFLLTSSLFSTAPVGNCESWQQSANWFTVIAVSATSFLFFFRVQALYRTSKPVIIFFFLLWVGVCCAGVIAIIGISGTQIGPTQYCVNAALPKNTYLLGVFLLINDTLTFLAISWRLLDFSLTETESFGERARVVLFGSNLPRFTRAFLKGGQQYYLTTVGFAVLATITLSLSAIPLPYRGVISIVEIMLLNVMACRVFRDTKLGVYHDTSEPMLSGMSKETRMVVAAPDHGSASSTLYGSSSSG
ncbi:hypothetical protein D9613_010416 [Agrocybe pediades]|uniref:Transmembrane protein n=1 Tax=Agrocybe pediades TaxID=84607 RepID=A0A8H4VHW8_9AGAR|nr:hypothetical protein D9613_010416 [Agrocybe pediades]